MIKTKGNQLLSIPNNREGRKFLKLFRKFLNRNSEYKVKLRGRGSRKVYGNQSDMPIERASWIALYTRVRKTKGR